MTDTSIVYTVTGDADDMPGWTSDALFVAVRAALEPLGISVEHRPHQLGEGGLDGDDWQEVERMRLEIEPILTEIIYAGPRAEQED